MLAIYLIVSIVNCLLLFAGC